MNTLMLDPADPAVAKAVADCKVGEEKSITVTGVVTKMGKTFEMDVTSAAYAEPEVEEEEAEEKPMGRGEMVGKGGKKGLSILIGRA